MKDLGKALLLTPWRGMLVYAVLGVAWVLAGDVLLDRWVSGHVQLTHYQTWKGWLFVALSSGLVWVLLQRMRSAEKGRNALAQELAQIVLHAPIGIARVAPDGRLLWANACLCSMLDLDFAQVLALNFHDVVQAHDREEGARQWARLLAGEVEHEMVERKCLRPGSRVVTPVLCTMTHVPQAGDEPAHVVCGLQELQGIEDARVALKISETRQRLASTVVDNTMEGVVVTDAHSRILSVNAAFTRMLGYTEAELLGQKPSAFKSGRHDKAFYEAMWASIHRTGHWQGEIWNRRKSGEVFPERMSLSAVRDMAGEVTHYVCMFTDNSEEQAQRLQLEFLAHNDALTGLFNRQWFGLQLDNAVQEASTSGEQLAVLLVNLDRFKDVNDSYGHTMGDEVLKHIARQMQSALRPADLLGRMAGDEFAVVARHLRHADGAAAVARQLIAAVAEPWHSPDGLEVVAGASVGICMFPTHASTGQALQQGAHAAVYGAKARGRGAWCFFHDDMTQAARERLELEARLRQAIAQGHLLLYYQPQVDIRSGRIVGAEALVRWLDPEEGLISPARFIPVAETSGIIGPLGAWVLGEACRQGRRWLDAGLPALTLAVNISPRQFHLTDLLACIEAALSESGFPAHRLELEITESALAEQPEEALRVLLGLGDLGLRLAVDDFGTGYSSLAHLKRFPIDVLKIDQGFIREIPQSSDDMAISTAIISMGHSLGLHVLAEGVETPAQLEFLRERGCDSYQGYLRSRPVPAADFAALLQAQAATAAQD